MNRAKNAAVSTSEPMNIARLALIVLPPFQRPRLAATGSNNREKYTLKPRRKSSQRPARPLDHAGAGESAAARTHKEYTRPMPEFARRRVEKEGMAMADDRFEGLDGLGEGAPDADLDTEAAT